MKDDLLEVAGGLVIKNADGVYFLLLRQRMTGDLYKELAEVAMGYGYIITSVIHKSGGVKVTFKEGELLPTVAFSFDYGAIVQEL